MQSNIVEIMLSLIRYVGSISEGGDIMPDQVCNLLTVPTNKHIGFYCGAAEIIMNSIIIK